MKRERTDGCGISYKHLSWHDAFNPVITPNSHLPTNYPYIIYHLPTTI